nr:MAG TPA: hypothetical protein [Caudoviricetes sp.]DAZ67628.1 MAG TPA: hypothetical protein [Caudoviricetes sp.]
MCYTRHALHTCLNPIGRHFNLPGALRVICCLVEFLMSRRLAVRRWLTSLSCRCFVSMG